MGLDFCVMCFSDVFYKKIKLIDFTYFHMLYMYTFFYMLG